VSPAIGVIGAGAWGTALAQALASDGSAVLLWAREAELVEEINRRRRNSMFLPSAELAVSISATSHIGDLAELPILLAVTPAQHLAAVLAGLPNRPRDLVLCAKGIEAGTGRLMAGSRYSPGPLSRTRSLPGCPPQ
jgi:glycerol-3-phosphate dehydrogenase (NAD(P)+)